MKRVHERLLGTFKLRDLMERGTLSTRGGGNAQVSGLVTDSRRVTPNSAFFALPGLRTNGNEYVQEALDRGAKVIISESDDLELPAGVTGVKVSDSRLALAHFARRYHGSPDSSIRVWAYGNEWKNHGKHASSHLMERPGARRTDRHGSISPRRPRSAIFQNHPRIRGFVRFAKKHACGGLLRSGYGSKFAWNPSVKSGFAAT